MVADRFSPPAQPEPDARDAPDAPDGVAPDPVTTAAPPVEIQATPPVETPVATPPPSLFGSDGVLDSYAPPLTAHPSAPLYQNGAGGGSRLFGPTTLTLAGPTLTVTAKRMRGLTAFLVVTGIVVGAFAFAGLVFYGIIAFGENFSYGGPDVALLNDTLKGTAAVAAVAALLYGAGVLASAGRKPQTISAHTSTTSGRKAGRLYVIRLPIPGKRRPRKLVLKPAGRADRAALAKIIAGLRG